MTTMERARPVLRFAAAVVAAGGLVLIPIGACSGAAPASQPAVPTAPASPHGAGMRGSPHSGGLAMPPHGGAATSQPAGGAVSALPPAPVRPILRGTTPVRKVTLRAFHRVFHDFVDDNATTLYTEFPIGDTEYTAEVVEYVPDFALNLKTREVLSRSTEPRNPAVRVLVLQKGVPQDTVWAMLSMPPHFARNSLLAFQIRRLELKNHAPIVAPETPAPPAPNSVGQKVKGGKTP